MNSDRLADDDLRALVVETMKSDPEANFDRISTRLRVRLGRPLESGEAQRLQEIYGGEGYAAGASGLTLDHAAHAASMASLSHSRPNTKEIIGLIAGFLPFFVHFQSGSATKTAGIANPSYFDLVAVSGGVVAIIMGFGAMVLLTKGAQRPFHLGLTGLVMVLGIYQIMLGLGLLHRIGIFAY